MFTTEDIIGDIIYISFRDKNRYSEIGVSGDVHYKVLGYDNFGIWVKHPWLEKTITVDKHGKPIRTDDVVHKEIDSNFLILWSNILTLMHYPDRKGFDFPSEFNKKYGFKIKDK